MAEIKNEEMRLNCYGSIVGKQLEWLARQYKYVELDDYVVMPNHVHGIIAINSELAKSNQNNTVGICRVNEKIIDTESVGTGLDLSLRSDIKILSLSNLMGAFKTTSSKIIHQYGLPEFARQRSFYDHIIRNQKELQNIRKYIYYNPAKWETDRNNPACAGRPENLWM